MSKTIQLMQRIAPALVLALVTATAQAQAVFRSVMPDGKIVYGNKPEPGAKESKQVNLVPLNISAPTPGSGGPAPAPAPTAENNAEIATAKQDLDAAQRALAAGREQQEGDRIGVAKGGGATSRLADSYYQRVKALEDAVAAAQAQFEAAQRNASNSPK